MIPHARRLIRGVWTTMMILGSAACGSAEKTTSAVASVTRAPFGALPSGDSVHVFTLTNANGVEVRIIDYGGIVLSLRTPDRNGVLGDVVLGYDDLASYVKATPYFGALVGRYANRIAKGKFTLDGKAYSLAVNNGPNALHGGIKGFDKVMWTAEERQDSTGVGVALTYTAGDGEEGFPGELSVRAVYTLSDDDKLSIDYLATSNKPTPINLTQHSYFNLAGDGAGDVLGHLVSINADAFTPVDSVLIPTGELRPVAGTVFDFRTPTAIGARIADADEQLARGNGYDHNFVLNRSGDGLTRAAHVVEPNSGRTLLVETTEPGIQFYTGNFLDGSNIGKGGHTYRQRNAFCLETQHFPDSPNQPAFPTTILRPGGEYRSRTVYTFGVQPQQR